MIFIAPCVYIAVGLYLHRIGLKKHGLGILIAAIVFVIGKLAAFHYVNYVNEVNAGHVSDDDHIYVYAAVIAAGGASLADIILPILIFHLIRSHFHPQISLSHHGVH